MQLNSERACSRAQISLLGAGVGIGRIDENSDRGCRGERFAHHLQQFRSYLQVEVGRARDVAARTAQARDEADLHGIADGREDDGNARRCRLRNERRRGGERDDDGHLALRQIGGHGGQPLVLAFGPAIFDGDIAAFGVARFTQAPAEGCQQGRPGRGTRGAQQPDYRRPLLRARNERQPSRRAAESQDEIAPPCMSRKEHCER